MASYKLTIYGEWPTREFPLRSQNKTDAEREGKTKAMREFIDGDLGWCVMETTLDTTSERKKR